VEARARIEALQRSVGGGPVAGSSQVGLFDFNLLSLGRHSLLCELDLVGEYEEGGDDGPAWMRSQDLARRA
jgi:hypothetical protein